MKRTAIATLASALALPAFAAGPLDAKVAEFSALGNECHPIGAMQMCVTPSRKFASAMTDDRAALKAARGAEDIFCGVVAKRLNAEAMKMDVRFTPVSGQVEDGVLVCMLIVQR